MRFAIAFLGGFVFLAAAIAQEYGSKPTAGMHHVWFEDPGSHEWQVWRKHLYDPAPRLFQ